MLTLKFHLQEEKHSKQVKELSSTSSSSGVSLPYLLPPSGTGKSHNILFGGERVDTNLLERWARASQEVCLNYRCMITGFLICDYSCFPSPSPPHSQDTSNFSTTTTSAARVLHSQDEAICCN